MKVRYLGACFFRLINYLFFFGFFLSTASWSNVAWLAESVAALRGLNQLQVLNLIKETPQVKKDGNVVLLSPVLIKDAVLNRNFTFLETVFNHIYLDFTPSEISTALAPSVEALLKYENDDEMLFFLLQNNASPDVPNENGHTSLHLAAKYGKVVALGHLLERSKEIDAKNIFDKTPLMVALEHTQWKAAQVLADKGASLASTYEDDENILMSTLKGISSKMFEDEIVIAEKLIQRICEQNPNILSKKKDSNHTAWNRFPVKKPIVILEKIAKILLAQPDGKKTLTQPKGESPLDKLKANVKNAETDELKKQYQDVLSMLQKLLRQ